MMVPVEKLAFLNSVEQAARAYVLAELADDPHIADEGCALYALAKALGLK